MTTSQRIGQLVLLVMLLVIVFLVVIQNVSGSEWHPESYEYKVLWVTGWVQPSGNGIDEDTGNIGIMLASTQCPDGAVEINYEVWPEIYLDEFLEECEGGIESIGGRQAINVMDHMLELRLQYGVAISESSYYITNMSYVEFWNEVFDAQAATKVPVATQSMYVYTPIVGR